MTDFSLGAILEPQIIAAEEGFLVVYKPPRMHSAPFACSTGETLLDFCLGKFPEILSFPGRKAGEGGLLHRLDYETQGLMLIARNAKSMEALLGLHREGKIIKGYSALVARSDMVPPGFPIKMPGFPIKTPGFPKETPGFKIKSAFRPYGPGRKAVRPVLPEKNAGRSQVYSTEILRGGPFSEAGLAGVFSLSLRITKGFRHQIRCHLAWLGLPILNDSLYGGLSFGSGLLALRAASIAFNDPFSGEERDFSIPPLSSELI